MAEESPLDYENIIDQLQRENEDLRIKIMKNKLHFPIDSVDWTSMYSWMSSTKGLYTLMAVFWTVSIIAAIINIFTKE